MPLYEYKCQQCGARSEVLQKMADAPLTTCEVCGGALKKLASSPSVQFKGSGWYVTDYARKSGGAGGKEAGGKDGGEKPAETAKGDSKAAGESKPPPGGGTSTASSAGSGSSSSGASSGGGSGSGGSSSSGGD